MWVEATGKAEQLYGSLAEADRVEYTRAPGEVSRGVRELQRMEDRRRLVRGMCGLMCSDVVKCYPYYLRLYR